MRNKLFILAILYFCGFSPAENTPEYLTFKDARDGKTYTAVNIFIPSLQQPITWMAENLDYATKGSEVLDKKFGRYYTWEAAQKACPSGWALPSKLEVMYLFEAAGAALDCDDERCSLDMETNGIAVSNNLRSKRSWDYAENKGTNQTGFNALAAGGGNTYGEFSHVGEFASFWTNKRTSENTALFFMISDGFVRFNEFDIGELTFPVRCFYTGE